NRAESEQVRLHAYQTADPFELPDSIWPAPGGLAASQARKVAERLARTGPVGHVAAALAGDMIRAESTGDLMRRGRAADEPQLVQGGSAASVGGIRSVTLTASVELLFGRPAAS